MTCDINNGFQISLFEQCLQSRYGHLDGSDGFFISSSAAPDDSINDDCKFKGISKSISDFVHGYLI